MQQEGQYTKEKVSKTLRAAAWIIVGTVVMILGIVLLAYNSVSRYQGGKGPVNDPAVAAALKPVGEAVVDPNQSATPAPAADATAPAADAAATPPAGESVAAAAPAADAAGGGADKGKALYDQICHACHKDGLLNSPKLGDKAAWAERLKAGKDALYASSINGKNQMPAKGGSTAPDEDIKAAVDYMLSQVQ